ncbi:MAG: hypothetical protein QOD74_3008 [Variibacter sp.]|jgi:hypothetical protein|nr:hypothetical protein [Variibacter sp.]
MESRTWISSLLPLAKKVSDTQFFAMRSASILLLFFLMRTSAFAQVSQQAPPQPNAWQSHQQWQQRQDTQIQGQQIQQFQMQQRQIQQQQIIQQTTPPIR